MTKRPRKRPRTASIFCLENGNVHFAERTPRGRRLDRVWKPVASSIAQGRAKRKGPLHFFVKWAFHSVFRNNHQGVVPALLGLRILRGDQLRKLAGQAVVLRLRQGVGHAGDLAVAVVLSGVAVQQ